MIPTIEDRIESLENRVKNLESYIAVSLPIYQPNPFEVTLKKNRCSKCGLDLNAVSGYVCSQFDCPTGLGPVSF